MRIFKKDDSIIGVCNERFIYLMEIYKETPRSFAYQGKYYLACKTPINITKELISTRDKDSKEWITRDFTLCFAPEKYLKKQGYYEL